jgi:hypothetical protein
MVGIFVTCWMMMFFGGSAIGLRKSYEQPTKPDQVDSKDRGHSPANSAAAAAVLEAPLPAAPR